MLLRLNLDADFTPDVQMSGCLDNLKMDLKMPIKSYTSISVYLDTSACNVTIVLWKQRAIYGQSVHKTLFVPAHSCYAGL